MKKFTILYLMLCLSLAVQAAPADKADKGKKSQTTEVSTPADPKADKKAGGPKADKKNPKGDKKAGGGERTDPKDPTDALAAQLRHTDALLEDPDIIGTAVSWQKNGDAIIKVYVTRKGVDVPASLDGIPIKVQRVGRIYATNIPCEARPGNEGCNAETEAAALAQDGGIAGEANSQRDWQMRPVPIGVSVGSSDAIAATLGCRVSRGCHNYALTNSHVVADTTAELTQPGAYDGGMQHEDAIASLYESVPIVLGTGAEVANRVDAAIFQIDSNKVGTATRSNGYGEPRFETLEPALNLGVMKYGRSSAMTNGYIDAINATLIVRYPSGDARFVEQLIIRSTSKKIDFSLPGDSGSLVVASDGDDQRKPVGLLFASGRGISVANPINDVLLELDIDIDGGI
jgi:hypothetical protein